MSSLLAKGHYYSNEASRLGFVSKKGPETLTIFYSIFPQGFVIYNIWGPFFPFKLTLEVHIRNLIAESKMAFCSCCFHHQWRAAITEMCIIDHGIPKSFKKYYLMLFSCNLKLSLLKLFSVIILLV